ncbi:hypothetical protein FSP39_011287 [Pinctada imbricata]|uniref:Uncharacterized protein n=1 Tax=Pinctada imbricata TaxID=66713 RepID=A0AA88YSI8_PINIB|nr:hypothetical protein FSP39_011287 [Pinctada imbricata]
MPELPGFEPIDVCCDELGRILICDSKNNSVHLIHEDGDFLQYVVTQNPLFGPRSIALSLHTMWLGCYDGKIRLYRYGEVRD